VTFIADSHFGRLSMDSQALLQVSPEVLAQALLDRRTLLKDKLPTVIRSLEAEEEKLEPRVARAVKNHDNANRSVAEMKTTRDSSQVDARNLLPTVLGNRDTLVDSGGMINLDPNWKKEKLLEKLDNLEEKIQTAALDHRAERKMLDIRKKLIEENESWLKNRRDSNPEMAEYIDSRRQMSTLFRSADKSHRNMLKAVEKAQPLHEKKVALQSELREVRRQLDRAKELLAQSDKSIAHWRRRLADGYGELDRGFPDLMQAKDKVAAGGDSSFARKSVTKKTAPIRAKRKQSGTSTKAKSTTDPKSKQSRGEKE